MCLSTSVALAVSSMVMMSKVQALARKATLVEAAAARPPFSGFVSCVATTCVHINSLRCA